MVHLFIYNHHHTCVVDLYATVLNDIEFLIFFLLHIKLVLLCIYVNGFDLSRQKLSMATLIVVITFYLWVFAMCRTQRTDIAPLRAGLLLWRDCLTSRLCTLL